MNTIVCKVNVANVMKNASHQSEVHTQFLYDDHAEIMEASDTQWIKVVSDNRQTIGWVLKSQFQSAEAIMTPTHICLGNCLLKSDGREVSLLSGTYIASNMLTNVSGFNDLIDLQSIRFEDTAKFRILKSFLNAPYHWGGTSVYGIDCSGLSKIFYKFFSIHLSHLASAQMEAGQVLDFLSNALCGDLAFFENDNNEINHVGILLNSDEIMHASETNGGVSIDAIDVEGIINKKSGARTHKLRLIKRILPSS